MHPAGSQYLPLYYYHAAIVLSMIIQVTNYNLVHNLHSRVGPGYDGN